MWTGSCWPITLRIVELHSPRVTSADILHKSDLMKARTAAREAGVSADTMDLSLMIARKLNCVENRGGRLVTTARAGRWAEEPLPERMRDLFTAFLASEELADLHMFFAQEFDAIAEHLLPGTLRRTYHRRLAAALLRELHAGAWYSVEQFIDAIRRTDRNVLFLCEQWRAIQANVRGDAMAWRERAWAAGEQRYFTWMIAKVCQNLGVLELDASGALFRITSMGSYMLGKENSEASRETPQGEFALRGFRCLVAVRQRPCLAARCAQNRPNDLCGILRCPERADRMGHSGF